jgi:hypothetical protein
MPSLALPLKCIALWGWDGIRRKVLGLEEPPGK